MEQPSRQFMITCTVITGVCVAVEFVLAVYALTHSTGVLDIPFYENGQIVRRQSKDAILLGPIYLQAMFCCVLIYVSIARNRLMRGWVERIARSNATQ